MYSFIYTGKERDGVKEAVKISVFNSQTGRQRERAERETERERRGGWRRAEIERVERGVGEDIERERGGWRERWWIREREGWWWPEYDRCFLRVVFGGFRERERGGGGGEERERLFLALHVLIHNLNRRLGSSS